MYSLLSYCYIVIEMLQVETILELRQKKTKSFFEEKKFGKKNALNCFKML